jgi:hypothetical protein
LPLSPPVQRGFLVGSHVAESTHFKSPPLYGQ